MGREILQVSLGDVLALAAQQHGVVTRGQLRELGIGDAAIDHRLQRGRLHRVHRGVYAVGRPQLARLGTLMAAVLTCGPDAALSHEQAAEVHGIRARRSGPIEVTVPPGAARTRPGLRTHRSALRGGERVIRHGIPATAPVRTLVDLATRLPPSELERAVGEADRLDLVDPERLRRALDAMGRRKGVAALRKVLDRRTFVMGHSDLERRFARIVRSAGLPLPKSQRRVGLGRVDFFWPDLDLVVETDGLRYHRTAAQQAVDRRRDQAHAAAGRTPLRFTHGQVAFESAHVATVLTAVMQRLEAGT
jgi:very-short-patch-repair endonuclease